MKKISQKIIFTCGLLVLSGCGTSLESLISRQAIEAPHGWQEVTKVTEVSDNWLASFKQIELSKLVDKALKNNLEIKQKAYAVKIREQQLNSAGSSFFPTLDLNFSQKRAGTTNSPVAVNTASLGLEAQYELDVWGKLSDAEKEATQNLLYAKATYEQARQQLAADVASAWFSVIEANHLLDLYKRRVLTAKNNEAIIEGGYDKGLNEALDVYLARNQLNKERSLVAEQEGSVKSAIRVLERYLGEYPEGREFVDGEIPVLDTPITLGLPQELIERKASLTASWSNLVSKNAALAYAHKQRLPSLTFTGTLSDSATLGTKLFNGDGLAWSLLGTLAAPIFDAGKLKAAEEVTRLELRQAEFQYLSDIYNAYQDVENAISTENSLNRQYESIRLAEDSAKTALDLSFEQYQRGLVGYTTVLESQSRYHDAQTSAIVIKAGLVTNRIRLHLAVGGDFSKQ